MIYSNKTLKELLQWEYYLHKTGRYTKAKKIMRIVDKSLQKRYVQWMEARKTLEIIAHADEEYCMMVEKLAKNLASYKTNIKRLGVD